MNSKTKIGSMLLLAAILLAGTISMTIPKSLAQPDDRDFIGEKYYGKDPYEKKYSFEDHKKYPFEKEHDKYSKGVNVQKIKCVNVNVNVNGVDVKKHFKGMETDPVTAEALQGDGATGGNGLFGNGINVDKNLVNICVNFNYNEQEDDGFKKPHPGPGR